MVVLLVSDTPFVSSSLSIKGEILADFVLLSVTNLRYFNYFKQKWYNLKGFIPKCPSMYTKCHAKPIKKIIQTTTNKKKKTFHFSRDSQKGSGQLQTAVRSSHSTKNPERSFVKLHPCLHFVQCCSSIWYCRYSGLLWSNYWPRNVHDWTIWIFICKQIDWFYSILPILL